jgi:hypothetical protein
MGKYLQDISLRTDTHTSPEYIQKFDILQRKINIFLPKKILSHWYSRLALCFTDEKKDEWLIHEGIDVLGIYIYMSEHMMQSEEALLDSCMSWLKELARRINVSESLFDDIKSSLLDTHGQVEDTICTKISPNKQLKAILIEQVNSRWSSIQLRIQGDSLSHQYIFEGYRERFRNIQWIDWGKIKVFYQFFSKTKENTNADYYIIDIHNNRCEFSPNSREWTFEYGYTQMKKGNTKEAQYYFMMAQSLGHGKAKEYII